MGVGPGLFLGGSVALGQHLSVGVVLDTCPTLWWALPYLRMQWPLGHSSVASSWSWPLLCGPALLTPCCTHSPTPHSLSLLGHPSTLAPLSYWVLPLPSRPPLNH